MSGTGSGVPELPGTYGPLVVDWLKGAEQPTPDAVALAILDLARQGALSLTQGPDGLAIHRVRAGHEDHEAAVMDLLFHRAGRGQEHLTVAQFADWLQMRPEESRRWLERWAEVVGQFAIGQLRGAPRGALMRRRQSRRDRDAILEAWEQWADEAELHGRILHPHPDVFAEWAHATLLAAALGRGVALLALIQRGLSESEQQELAGSWCPTTQGQSLAEAFQAVWDQLPCLGATVAQDEGA